MGNKNNRQTTKEQQGEKVEMQNKAIDTKPADDKATGNPNEIIKQAVDNQPNQSAAVFDQVVDPNDVDKLLAQRLDEASQAAYNFGMKYVDVASDFKKIGDAIASYSNVYKQKLALEQQQKEKQKNNKQQKK